MKFLPLPWAWKENNLPTWCRRTVWEITAVGWKRPWNYWINWRSRTLVLQDCNRHSVLLNVNYDSGNESHFVELFQWFQKKTNFVDHVKIDYVNSVVLRAEFKEFWFITANQYMATLTLTWASRRKIDIMECSSSTRSLRHFLPCFYPGQSVCGSAEHEQRFWSREVNDCFDSILFWEVFKF